MRFLIITGTGTGVGKTVVTAAIAHLAAAAGLSVCVVKPVQTGVASVGSTGAHPLDTTRGAGGIGSLTTAVGADQAPPGSSDRQPADTAAQGGGTDSPDICTVKRLSECRDVHQLVTLADPLAPDTAARLRGLTIPTVRSLSQQVESLATGHDVALVEGSGGVAVRLDTAGGTLIDLAGHLTTEGHRVDFAIVTGLALGTLNFTELTVQALHAAGQAVAGLVLGDVPACLGLAEQCNLHELPRVAGVPVLGALPHGVGAWESARFQAACRSWFAIDPLRVTHP